MKESIRPEILADISEALRCVREGGVILYPTDTVWGIGCDSRCDGAVRKIFAIKERSEAKAMISLVSDVGMFSRFTRDVPDVGYELMLQAVKPLTLVVDAPCGISRALCAADGSAAFRISSHVWSRTLSRRMGAPLVSTSANKSGLPTPKFFREISADILEAVDYVARSYRCDEELHEPSSVVKLTNSSVITVIRP